MESGYGPKQIPQIADINQYLKSKTGFQMYPVTGLLSARDFLNALAFRTFCSTQYIRHGGNPFYTPEPDIIHELVGKIFEKDAASEYKIFEYNSVSPDKNFGRTGGRGVR